MTDQPNPYDAGDSEQLSDPASNEQRWGSYGLWMSLGCILTATGGVLFMATNAGLVAGIIVVSAFAGFFVAAPVCLMAIFHLRGVQQKLGLIGFLLSLTPAPIAWTLANSLV